MKRNNRKAVSAVTTITAADETINTTAIDTTIADVTTEIDAMLNEEPIDARFADIETLADDVVAPFTADDSADIVIASNTAEDDDLGDILASINTIAAEPVIEAEVETVTIAESAEAAVDIILDNIAENAAAVVADAAVEIAALTIAEPDAVETVTTAVKAAKVPKVARVVDRAKFLEAVGAPDETTFAASVAGVAKKVREKIDNVADAISSGKRLSNYTRDALAYALANDSAFTVKDLVTMFEAKKYSPGTARAQAQQMGAVFNALGAADRAGKSFTLKAGPMLDALKGAVAPVALAA